MSNETKKRYIRNPIPILWPRNRVWTLHNFLPNSRSDLKKQVNRSCSKITNEWPYSNAFMKKYTGQAAWNGWRELFEYSYAQHSANYFLYSASDNNRVTEIEFYLQRMNLKATKKKLRFFLSVIFKRSIST